MDSRKAFLEATSRLIIAYLQIAGFRIVGNTAISTVLRVNLLDRREYDGLNLYVVDEIRKVTPREFRAFDLIFCESSMVLAYSWLETFLDEVEEALYLQDPAHLGDNIQLKLGKVLSATSIHDLIHDVAKRRVRDRSQWSLVNRLRDLKDRYGFSFVTNEVDIVWITDTRNNIIHNRRLGTFQVTRKAVSYKTLDASRGTNDEQTARFLRIVAVTLKDLYRSACKALKITNRYPKHKDNLGVLKLFEAFGTHHKAPPNDSASSDASSARADE